MTRFLKSAAALTVLLGALLLPAVASAEYLVPEGNSAVNQYTESIPGAGGEVGTQSGKPDGGVTSAEAIGEGNAKKLSKAGPEGQAAAEVAIETAPEAVPTPEPVESEAGGSDQPANGHKAAHHAHHSHHKNTKHRHKPKPGQAPRKHQSAAAGNSSEGPGGSSGTNSLFSAATGTEGGHLGLLLPIVVLAAIVGGAAYVLRQRNRTALH